MLDIATPGRGPSRRTMLRAGVCALGGLSLPDLLRLRAAGAAPRTDRSVVVLWVHGGPSHLETYDLKPDAPSDCRSIFAPTRTRVPGLDVCELLPKHAAIADKFTLLRSVAHDEADHGFGTRRFATGYAKPIEAGGNGPAYFPAYEAVINRALGLNRGGVPVSVNVGPFRASTPWRGPGYLGTKYDVPQTQVHPDARVSMGFSGTTLTVAPDRFADRRGLLGQFDKVRSGLDAGAVDAMDEFTRQAYAVLTTGKVARAVDVGRETPALRDKYDEFGFGQDLLLARRLVEAGVSFVNVYVHGAPHGRAKGNWYNWDDHAVNWDMAAAMRDRLPWYDHIVTTFLEDLDARGLLETTLVLVTGEFGRTPRLERPADGRVGRDHWPSAMSILVAGGGRPRRGDVVGATNAKGEYPVTRKLDPHDVLATIYHYLGIDPKQEFIDVTGRPQPITRGEPIDGLV